MRSIGIGFWGLNWGMLLVGGCLSTHGTVSRHPLAFRALPHDPARDEALRAFCFFKWRGSCANMVDSDFRQTSGPLPNRERMLLQDLRLMRPGLSGCGKL